MVRPDASSGDWPNRSLAVYLHSFLIKKRYGATFSYLTSAVPTIPTIGGATCPLPALLCFAVEGHPRATLAPAPPLTSPDDACTAAPIIWLLSGHWGRCACAHARWRWALAWKPSGLATSYGCGAPMQTAEEAAPRYDVCFKRTFQMF
jgi:hypothetical protein